MSLYFITGIAGSGKTTVQQELKARGFKAYDTDNDGLAKWHNNETGYVHPKSSVKPEQRTPAFLDQHSWKVSRKEVEALIEDEDNPIFLCGYLANSDELVDMFKKSFALVIDEKTLISRLLTRTSGDWGKQTHELQHTISDRAKTEELYKRLGYKLIDANQPLNHVVNEILTDVNIIEQNNA